MRAIVTRAYGSEQEMRVEDLPTPTPKAQQILVKIHACSVNPVDWKVLRGDFKLVTGRKPPIVLGGDFAGVVDRVGASVTAYAVGDPVWGHINAFKGGAYAEYIVVDEVNIDAKPSGLSFEDAASVPLAGLTAYQALVHHAKVSGSDRVLINGCTGGIGTLAVQIAKALGCTVTGICSGKNADLARQLGCDQVVDYHETDLLKSGLEFDVFFDAVGNVPFGRARAVLSPAGRYVTVVPSTMGLFVGSWLNAIRSQKYHAFLVESSSEDLAELRRMVEGGQMKTMVQDIYPINQISAANQQSSTGRTVGKIVLKTAESGDWL